MRATLLQRHKTRAGQEYFGQWWDSDSIGGQYWVVLLVVSIGHWWSILGTGGDEGMFPISRRADSPGLSSVHKAILC